MPESQKGSDTSEWHFRYIPLYFVNKEKSY